MRMRLLLPALALLFIASSVRAEEDIIVDPPSTAIVTYVPANYLTLTQAAIRFGAYDTDSDAFLDEYAAVAECDLYRQFYKDDFTWHKLRQDFRDHIDKESRKFPDAFALKGTVRLDRYDFKQQAFLLTPETEIKNVNVFTLSSHGVGDCDPSRTYEYFPRSYRALLDQGITLKSIPMTEEKGKKLLALMEADNNKNRVVYITFNLRVYFVDRFKKADGKSNEGAMHLDSRLDSISFYEDEARTMPIWTYYR
jgi:hypothetical protein